MQAISTLRATLGGGADQGIVSPAFTSGTYVRLFPTPLTCKPELFQDQGTLDQPCKAVTLREHTATLACATMLVSGSSLHVPQVHAEEAWLCN